jgi:hypothetical protein
VAETRNKFIDFYATEITALFIDFGTLQRKKLEKRPNM